MWGHTQNFSSFGPSILHLPGGGLNQPPPSLKCGAGTPSLLGLKVTQTDWFSRHVSFLLVMGGTFRSRLLMYMMENFWTVQLARLRGIGHLVRVSNILVRVILVSQSAKYWLKRPIFNICQSVLIVIKAFLCLWSPRFHSSIYIILNWNVKCDKKRSDQTEHWCSFFCIRSCQFFNI